MKYNDPTYLLMIAQLRFADARNLVLVFASIIIATIAIALLRMISEIVRVTVLLSRLPRPQNSHWVRHPITGCRLHPP